MVLRQATSGVAFVWHYDQYTFLGDQLLFNVDPAWQQGPASEAVQKSALV